MSKSGDEMVEQRDKEGKGETGNKMEELPLETSPYINYTDLEDYKRKGYGTEGNLPLRDTPGGGGTDAPTLSGTGISSSEVEAIDSEISRHPYERKKEA